MQRLERENDLASGNWDKRIEVCKGKGSPQQQSLAGAQELRGWRSGRWWAAAPARIISGLRSLRVTSKEKSGQQGWGSRAEESRWQRDRD